MSPNEKETMIYTFVQIKRHKISGENKQTTIQCVESYHSLDLNV